MKTQVTKQYRAEIAHRLPGHPGGCQYIHGHSYQFDVTAEAIQPKLNELGMVVDFKDLKAAIDHVIAPWDHSLVLWEEDPIVQMVETMTGCGVRLVLVPFIPTAENMAAFVAAEINALLPFEIRIAAVKVWETATSYAEWRRGC